MIYTVTFNPAVDCVVFADRIIPGEVNKAEKQQLFFGGKGINVSQVLSQLGIESVAMGFTAGFTGEAIESGLKSMGIKTDFVRLDSGFSRINVKIRSGEETEINGSGPDIPREKVDDLFRRLSALKSGDVLILAGSVPASMPVDIYEQILAAIQGKGVLTVVDAAKSLLTVSLKYKPFLVKPNADELGEIFGVKISSPQQAAEYAAKLRDEGAANVLVSLAGSGAVLLDEYGETHYAGVCKGTVINSVGAGDSMVAGFIAGCQKQTPEGKRDYGYALKLGTAAGGATAFSDGLATARNIGELLAQLG